MKRYERTIAEHIREHALRNKGLVDMANLERSEWSTEFEKLMRNRLIMGAMRYGKMDRPAPNSDFVGGAIERLKIYQETGNTECLVDAANLSLMEFERGEHPNKHFKSVDDDIHVPKRNIKL